MVKFLCPEKWVGRVYMFHTAYEAMFLSYYQCTLQATVVLILEDDCLNGLEWKTGTCNITHIRPKLMEYCWRSCAPICYLQHLSRNNFFGKDNAPCHHCRIESNGWMNTHRHQLSYLLFTARSPRLNAVDHVWNAIKSAIRDTVLPPLHKLMENV